MNEHPEGPLEKSWDEALAQRLAKLGAMPVDTSALERRVKSQVGEPPQVTAARSAARRRHKIARPMLAMAASAAIVLLVLIVLQGREVRASADMMAQMHRDIVSGKVATMKAETIADANAAFAAFGGNTPQLTEPPESHTMACCMQNVANRKVACVLLENAGVPVTMAVADADAVETGAGSSVVFQGENFRVQICGELTMISVERGKHRLCLIGALPAEKLMAMSGGVKF